MELFELTAPCHFGLEAVLKREILDLGYEILQVGTGDSPLTVPFYEACGFVRSHTIPGFFTEHYDHPIFEGGELLTDMIYLQKKL